MLDFGTYDSVGTSGCGSNVGAQNGPWYIEHGQSGQKHAVYILVVEKIGTQNGNLVSNGLVFCAPYPGSNVDPPSGRILHRNWLTIVASTRGWWRPQCFASIPQLRPRGALAPPNVCCSKKGSNMAPWYINGTRDYKLRPSC